MKRQWQVFPGKNRFYFNGRCISGPDRTSFWISLMCLLVTVILFFSFVSPWLLRDLYPYGIIIWVTMFILCAFAITTFLITALMDPGIIPRDNRMKTQLDKNPFSRVATKAVNIKGNSTKLKFCDTCSIFRPPRSTHCSVCNNCVRRFDHHCPWIGNCIGERNYNYFLWFVMSVSLLTVYATVVCIVEVIVLSVQSDYSGFLAFLDALSRAPVNLIIAFFTFIVFGFVTSLACFHWYLIWKNQTTNETLKGIYKTKESSPFWVGCLPYCLNVFFPSTSPSAFDFTAEVQEESEHSHSHR